MILYALAARKIIQGANLGNVENVLFRLGTWKFNVRGIPPKRLNTSDQGTTANNRRCRVTLNGNATMWTGGDSD